MALQLPERVRERRERERISLARRLATPSGCAEEERDPTKHRDMPRETYVREGVHSLLLVMEYFMAAAYIVDYTRQRSRRRYIAYVQLTTFAEPEWTLGQALGRKIEESAVPAALQGLQGTTTASPASVVGQALAGTHLPRA